jgi:hypothetical protein
MFSKFSLDEVDPISKLGAKVEPSYTPECARKWDAAAEVSALRLFELRSHDIPEQKAVVGPWPELPKVWFDEAAAIDPTAWMKLKPPNYDSAGVVWFDNLNGGSKTVPTLYDETEVPRSAYWQEQMGETEALTVWFDRLSQPSPERLEQLAGPWNPSREVVARYDFSPVSPEKLPDCLQNYRQISITDLLDLQRLSKP